MLIKDKLEDFNRGIDDQELPRTFQHAIQMTRRLGIRYIWIDSLCIIQDDNEDWQREAPLMEKVYGNSYCNIAAADAKNSTEGLFRSRKQYHLPPSATKAIWVNQNAEKCTVVRDDFWKGELLSAPLYTRAWVFQERMLSPRVLHFGKHQVFWQCLDTMACESAPKGLPLLVGNKIEDELEWRRLAHRPNSAEARSSADKVKLQEIWDAAVATFSSCELTKKTDKLVAIASLAKVMRNAFDERYVAGLWQHVKQMEHGTAEYKLAEQDFAEQLAWRVQGCKTADGAASRRQRPPEFYRAPSWAWPSVDGVVQTQERVLQRRDYVLQISEQPELTPRDSDLNVWRLDSGSLKVKARLYALTFSSVENDRSEWWWTNTDGTDYPEFRLYLDEPPTSNADLRPVLTLSCSVLLLVYSKAPPGQIPQGYSGRGLALKPSDSRKSYSRIGMIEFRYLTDEMWQSLEINVMDASQVIESEAFDDTDGCHSITLV